MNKENNIFENAIRETLENHEVPYDASVWESLSAKLPSAIPFYKTNWFKGGAALILIAAITSVALWDNSPKVNQEKLASNTILDTKEVKNNLKSISTNEISASVDNDTENNNIDETESNSVDKKEVTKTVSGDKNKVNQNTDVASGEGKDETKNNETKNIGKQVDEAGKGETNTIPPVKDPVKPNKDLKETPKANFSLEKEICQNSKIHLKANNISEEGRYSWKINDLEEIRVENLSFVLENEGVNKVTLFVKDNKGKLLSKMTKEIFVRELPQNNVRITSDENSIVNKYTFELLEDESTVVWNFGDNKRSSDLITSHSFEVGNVYKCNYTIVSKDGCKVTHKKDLKVKGYYNIRDTYGFSPNNDGRNDDFIPVELKLINQPFEMIIQSRTGALIYKTNSIDSPWNGNLKDGTKSSFGTYVWRISLTNELGVQETYQGTVTNVTN